MTSPRVTVCGAYRLDVSPELLTQAMAWKYAGDFASARAREAADDHVREELCSAVLLDVRIDDCDERFRVDDFGQPGSDQAAYMEVFLTPDGSAAAPAPAAPVRGGTVRVVFYLHFLAAQKPLRTSYGEVAIPPLQQMPLSLAELTPYEPVT